MFDLGSGLYGMGTDSQFYVDYAEAAKLDPVQPGTAGKAWWENMLEVGLTRAIDSHFKNDELDRILKVNEHGIQAANGSTVPAGVPQQFINPGAFAGLSMTTLLLIGLGVFVVMKVAD